MNNDYPDAFFVAAPDCGDPMPMVGRPEGSPPPCPMPDGDGGWIVDQ